MLISAVILSYNSERYLEPCLRSLLDALKSLPEDSEILVVENGSRDRSPEILRRFESSHPDIVTGFYYGVPFLENMGIFDHKENPGTIYHLKPKVTADWIRRVDRTLKNSYFKIGMMDPSDAVYDEFYPQARQIQSASLIVASLVGSANVNWPLLNVLRLRLRLRIASISGRGLVTRQRPPLFESA